jgi:hypothetical protein
MVGGLAACWKDDAKEPVVEVRQVAGPVNVGTLNDVCDQNVALTDAPPYAGVAPHAFMVFSQGQGNDRGSRPSIRIFDMLEKTTGRPFQNRPDQTQLVACAERMIKKSTDIECSFDIGADRVPFFRASWRITIREAHTGKVVATVPVDPGGAGCPTSAKVAWGGAEVYSGLSDQQIRYALEQFVYWDGTGTPPGSAEPLASPAVAGAPVVQGSVRLTTAAGIDAAAPVIRDYLAFWAGYAQLEEVRRSDPRPMRSRVDREFYNTMLAIVDSRNRQTKLTRGPVHIMVTGVSKEGGTVSVDSCVDQTEREELEASQPNGTIGAQYRIRLTMKNGGRYLASGFADAPPAPCPPAVARIR